MEEFLKNIDALEDKTKIFIQKWKEIQSENQQLIERNKKLEEEKGQHNKQLNTVITKREPSKSELNANLLKIQEALDQYIERLDACIELLNIELNGK